MSDADDLHAVQFAVEFEHRASKTMKRMDVINAFVDHVPKVRIPSTAFGCSAMQYQGVEGRSQGWKGRQVMH